MSLESPQYPTLHTVMICQLPSSGQIECQARSVLGNWFREHYVAQTHVFLWSDKAVYALDLKTLSLMAHKVEGFPIDQFSFKKDGDNLFVLAQNYRDAGRSLHLYRLPISQFNGYGNQDLSAVTQNFEGSQSDSYYTTNRYVEGNLILGQNGGLLIVPLSGADTTRIPLSAPVVRIEALTGIGALVVTQSYSGDRASLLLKTLSLGAAPRMVNSIPIEGMQGEWRSHGFFFKPSGLGGTLGLPIVDLKGGGFWWGSGTANVAFLSVGLGGELTQLGSIASTPASEGDCETSCIDWYGNTRPIFLRDRVFALMGNELQEVGLTTDKASPTGKRLVFGK